MRLSGDLSGFFVLISAVVLLLAWVQQRAAAPLQPKKRTGRRVVSLLKG